MWCVLASNELLLRLKLKSSTRRLYHRITSLSPIKALNPSPAHGVALGTLGELLKTKIGPSDVCNIFFCFVCNDGRNRCSCTL